MEIDFEDESCVKLYGSYYMVGLSNCVVGLLDSASTVLD